MSESVTVLCTGYFRYWPVLPATTSHSLWLAAGESCRHQCHKWQKLRRRLHEYLQPTNHTINMAEKYYHYINFDFLDAACIRSSIAEATPHNADTTGILWNQDHHTSKQNKNKKPVIPVDFFQNAQHQSSTSHGMNTSIAGIVLMKADSQTDYCEQHVTDTSKTLSLTKISRNLAMRIPSNAAMLIELCNQLFHRQGS